MSKKLKVIIFAAIAVAFISATIFLKKERHFAQGVDVKNGLGIKTSLVNIQNNNVLYIKCRFKNAGVLRNSIDKHGISAVLGILMFRKINGLSTGEIQEKMHELGLKHFSVDAFEDDFKISFHLLKDKALESLQFLSTAFSELEFSRNDLEFAKENFPNILDVDSSHPQELLLEKLMNLLYQDHLYGLSNTGTGRAISSITVEDIDNFMKSNFVKNNLEVTFAGDISRFEVRKYLDILFAKLLTKEPITSLNEKIKANLSDEKTATINKQNMEDIAGVMSGVRLDALTDIEQAAARVIMNTLYDDKTGDFIDGLRSQKIAYNVMHSSIKRSLSNVFYVSVFIEKKDLKNYLKYFEKKIRQYSKKTNFRDMKKVKRYFAKQFHTGFADLTDIDEQRESNSLPFDQVNQEILTKVIKKLFDISKIKTVIIGNDI